MPDPAPEPAGLGSCRKCAFLETGTPSICYRCARKSMEQLAPFAERCGVCDLELKSDGTCGNPICSWDDRWFDSNYAVAMRSGILKEAIMRFKYENKHGWGSIFGRVLVGFLEEQLPTFQEFDLIVASPGFLDPAGQRQYDHARQVVFAAHSEDEVWGWPFDVADPPVIIKTKATTRLATKTKWRDRHDIAISELRDALVVPDPARVEGSQVLVYDDLFTDGLTLNEVARCLRLAGAARVCGVSLTRQPWGGR